MAAEVEEGISGDDGRENEIVRKYQGQEVLHGVSSEVWGFLTSELYWVHRGLCIGSTLTKKPVLTRLVLHR